jgi:hypothetical protein
VVRGGLAGFPAGSNGRSGRVLLTSRLASTLTAGLAIAMPASPRKAALRVHLLRLAPRAMATANHSTP